MDTFKRINVHFLRVNITFCDEVNMIHDIIRTANPFTYTAKLMFAGVRNNRTQRIRCQKINRIHSYIHTFAIHQKYLTLARNDNFGYQVCSFSYKVFKILFSQSDSMEKGENAIHPQCFHLHGLKKIVGKKEKMMVTNNVFLVGRVEIIMEEREN